MVASFDSESVVLVDDFPQSSIGAPFPAVIATEDRLALVFILEDRDLEWDGKTVRVVDVASTDEQCVVVHFEHPTMHIFGPPNDEAFSGHRLASKGLRPYGVFEVINSEWIRQLEIMNSVHPQHDPERFYEGKRHFIFSFHDSVFECVARGYRYECMPGSVKHLLTVCAQHIDP
ncbi:hypothetical protein [uncultured Massilia sp.]|uniref:hypothetical protein n=1 Tax=uncultured Massilia sp. TaxID=169973 RepID=UPI00258E337C|nr:hypothetical protein [uncultured Massilia sp.]